MRFKRNVEAHGPREALAILDIVDSDAPALTLGQWMDDHVAGRTGLQGATRDKYERFAEKAFPELRDLPLAPSPRPRSAGGCSDKRLRSRPARRSRTSTLSCPAC